MTNSVLPAISGPVLLQTTIHNVVIGIINEPRKLRLRTWNLRFSALEPEPSSLFWLILPSMLHQAGQFRNQLIHPVYF